MKYLDAIEIGREEAFELCNCELPTKKIERIIVRQKGHPAGDEIVFGDKMKILYIIIILFYFPLYAYALDSEKATLAIIGEAESEPMQGKIAVGEVLRHRNSFKGIYGLNSPRIKAKAYSKAIYRDCSFAWQTSKTTNYSKGALYWENVEKFGWPKWTRGHQVVICAKIGHHVFFNVK